MPIQIVRNDITKMNCDAIVNAANQTLLGGGGVDGAIHRAAGPELLAECKTMGGCHTGEAKITGAYRLPCKYVIHTVGPVWRGGGHHEEEKLISCYRNSLKLAEEYHCESVAFPLISAGAYGYPKEQALQIAVSEICKFLIHHDIIVYIVVFDKDCFQISKRLIHDITEYIDECYVEAHYEDNTTRLYTYLFDDEFAETMIDRTASLSLSDAIGQIDESFSEMLMRKIDEKGMTDVQCYKKANVDRKLFSKIRSNPQYKPRKTTAAAFAVALELPFDEAKDLLSKAGYSLTHSNKFDIIIEYFLKKGEYDIFTINEALFEFDQVLLG
ncbi:O-acetyl-ADP-ribose deacetylase (regulator of RNase III), contains Macro domain [Ruminococcaceae bacterium P7]|nr:O-acetyl-ADP-ribose deacetylase (regulator of RNase III), contains Macro domain [Ruminococcaceae bacterium P7]